MSRPPGNRQGSRAWFALGVLAPPLLLLAVAWLTADANGATWAPSSLAHPLGTDEFGRDILYTAIAAAGLSLAKGLAMTGAVLLLGFIVAEAITLAPSTVLSATVRTITRIVESVPVVMWVLVVVATLDQHRSLVAGIAFTLVVLPSATSIIAGELLRIRHAPFVEAAYLLGVSEPKVLLRHILPGMRSVLVPFAIQVLGAAVAIEGAIGVIGLGSRQDLDLGMFLIRGKENFQLHPHLLVVAIAMYAAIYAYLLFLIDGQGRYRVEGARS